MNKEQFLENIIPGNYFITKSMELTKSNNSGTLWYTKKFLVLYYYVFLNDNITTLSVAKEICNIFDDYIKSLPLALQDQAEIFFYASEDIADLRSENFKLFGDFAGQIQFTDDNAKTSYYESAKKYYFAFLMESGGQSGVNKWIKDHLYQSDFCYSDINDIIQEWAEDNALIPEVSSSHLDNYRNGNVEAAITGMRNDYMAFIRNERQILFYYGFFHSKSSGSNDREFSSLTPIGALAIQSNFYELIAIWEHQKIKMISQPVNIDIRGLQNSVISDTDKFVINTNPYLTIIQSLKSTMGFSKEVYQYVISRLAQFPPDGLDTSAVFIDLVKNKVNGFNRNADVATEDFNKELLKYILGIRSDLAKDNGCNPFGLCKWNNRGLTVTDLNKLDRLIEVYTILCNYKNKKYQELFQNCSAEIKRQYVCNARGEEYNINPKYKIEWDMYNIHTDLLILLSVTILLLEAKDDTVFSKDTLNQFVDGIKALCPNILELLGLSSKTSLKKELMAVLPAFSDGMFDKYLEETEGNYRPSIATYLNESLADLERKIKDNSSLAPTYIDGVRKRNMALIGLIKTYNLQKYTVRGAVLKCECCGQPTFVTYKNEPYVEYHHLIPFSEYDGPDHSLNILALCPMCHRKLHFLKPEDKQPLYSNIAGNSYKQLSIEERLSELHGEHKLKSYQLEFLLADNAIDEAAYNRILKIA
ncbi:MAG: HNH endonuclease [Paludibacteraceae bacterium]|nr:HNH endonuclease [Paludibacteraceae bacterium]